MVRAYAAKQRDKILSNDKRRGIAYMLVSIVGFALMNLVVKILGTSENPIPAPELVFFRSLVSLVLSLWFIRRKKISPFGNNKKWLILRGVFGVTALTTFFYTLQELPLSAAIILQYLSPIFTALFAVWLLGEVVKGYQWLFFLMSFLGIAVIRGFDESIDTTYMLLGIMSSIFAGLAYNAIGKLRHTDDPVVIVFYFPLLATPIMGLLAITGIVDWVMPLGWDWGLLLLMGVLTQIAQIAMTKAFQSSELSGLAAMKYLGIIFALSFDFFIFGVTYSWITLLGMILVISGVLLNLFFKPRKKVASPATK